MALQIPQEILDEIAILEVKALVSGLKDEDMIRNPAFLEKVRRFLRDNKLQTVEEQIKIVKMETKEIPEFEPEGYIE